jgi:putative ABC transport system permease protein
MLQNYLKIAVRNLLRHKLHSLINISGLAIGMACCVLIMVFLQDELSYDKFHENVERIFLVTEERGSETRVRQGWHSPISLASSLTENFPEVIQATAIREIREKNLIRYGDKSFREDGIMFADEHVFEVLSFPFLSGDPATALRDPSSIVITRSAAEKYFGTEDPLGKVLHVNTMDFADDFQITAVVEGLPHNSHIRPDYLISLAYASDGRFFSSCYTLVLLDEGASPEMLEGGFTEVASALPIVQQKLARAKQTVYRLRLEPLGDVHMRFNPRILYIYVFAGIALVILLLACVNYMNLATAQAVGRAKEVGVRKVVGALRGQLLGQFLSESLLLSCIALVLAVALVESILPVFNNFLGTELSMRWQNDGRFWLGLAGVALFTGIIAGGYPALFLSTFRPVQVLKGRLRLGTRGSYLRKGLVIFQFTISSLLILVVATMYYQMNYVRSKGMGFDKEQVVVLSLQGVTTDRVAGNRTFNGIARTVYYRQFFASGASLETAKRELLTDSRIAGVAVAAALPGQDRGAYGQEYYGAEERRVRLLNLSVDPDFIDVLGIPLLAGRDIGEADRRDLTQFDPAFEERVVINESAARALGWEDPVGRQLWRDHHRMHNPETGEVTVKEGTVGGPVIVGVVADFHFQSLRQPIEPLAINPLAQFQRYTDGSGYLLVRIASGEVQGALGFLEEKWRELAPEQPFEFSFLNEEIERVYQTETRLLQALGLFSALAIFIACLGLFGLVSFMAEARTKEIGIRKVLGASTTHITTLLAKDFVKLVIAAHLISWPIAYFALRWWLQNFAYRIDLGSWIFLLCGGLTLVIALATVGGRAVRAALANPVEALRYE